MDNFHGWLLTEMPMQTGNDVGLLVGEDNFFAIIKSVPGLQRLIADSNYEKLEQAIYGAMAIRQNDKYNAIEVDKVWARPGYGPLLYYIAMTQAGTRGLMSSRVSNQVSNQAKEIWQNFESGVGKERVKEVPLETDWQHHPESYLMKKYVLLEPLNLSIFLRRAALIIGRDPRKEKLITMLETAEAILDREMNTVYGND